MIITVGAEKGGVGKTRLSTHIAAMAACSDVDVVLLDTDKQGSAISWAGIRADQQVEPTFPVLALPPNPGKEVANLSEKYELVVVDIGAQNYKTMLECVLLSDIVLVPCGPDQQEIESTLKVFGALNDLGLRHQSGKIPAHVVITRCSPIEAAKSTRDMREFLKSEGISVFDAQLAHRESWKATGKTGRSVLELKGKDWSSKAAAEMQAVYDEILRRAN
jgi:chromosome partitioning protein